MMSDSELKPCPFCGCDNIQKTSDGGCRKFTVYCTECPAEVTDYGWGDEAHQAAHDAWNRRVT